jgi:chorismate synthase
MTGNMIGERFVLVSFGESHGKCVGAVIDGCPAGLPLSDVDVQKELDLRRPGESLVSSQRKEEDRVEILSGTFRGHTTGAPIAMMIRNEDADPRPYEAIANTPRPGHADLTAKMKYGGFNDYRGGGRFSGRTTASYVMGGSVAKKLLRDTLGVEIAAYTLEIGGIRASPVSFDEALSLRYSNDVRCPDPKAARAMTDKIMEARRLGDSLGGIVECTVRGVPAGFGEPVFAALDSDLAKAILSIPAVKGVEFGAGFGAVRLRGSENNDQFRLDGDRVVSDTNNSGGILGGLSNGMPIVFRAAFKPAASIVRRQRTVDLSAGKETEISVPGRHDPTVVPRAIPVVESVAALVFADHGIHGGFIPPVLKARGGDEQR